MERLKLLLLLLGLTATVTSLDADCKNGGFPTGDACRCPNFWGGPDCNTIECINGGYVPTDGNRCICPPGYLGVHCDAVTLIQPPADQFASSPTFNLVYINLFSDYWGGAAKDQFQTAVDGHLTKNKAYYQGRQNIIYNSNFPTSKDAVQDPNVYNFTTNIDNITGVLGEPIMFPKYYACYQVPVIDYITNVIKEKQLRQTAITVLTQHPLVGDTWALINLANSFGIRINILWSEDDVFVRCENNDVQAMKDLSRQTGGIFVSLSHDDKNLPQSIIDAVLMSHYAYQPTDFAYTTSTSLTMSFLAYPIPTQNYFLFTTGKLDVTQYPGEQLFTSDNMNAYYIQQLVQRNIFNIDCTKAVDECIGLVFTNDANSNSYPLTVYSSFVEDPVIDSSNTQPDSGNLLHVALHVRNDASKASPISVSTANNFQGSQTNQVSLTMTARDRATFEFISQDKINCTMSAAGPPYKYWWSTIIFSVGGTKMQRFVRYNCNPVSPNFSTTTVGPTSAIVASTGGPSSTLVSSTGGPSSTAGTGSTAAVTDSSTGGPSSTAGTGSTAAVTDSSTGGPSSTAGTGSTAAVTEFLTTIVPTTGVPLPGTDEPCPASVIYEPLQFISGYADTVNQSIYNDFTVQTYQSAGNIYQKYGIIRFEVKDTKNILLVQNDTYDGYRADVYVNMAWNDTLAAPQQTYSQILKAIQTIRDGSVSQNAFVSFLVDRLPLTTDFIIKDYYALVNRNIKLFMLMDVAAFKRELSVYQRNSYPLNTLAALTGGHFIVSDQYDSETFRTLLTNIHENTAKQNLLISRNFQLGQMNLGKLDLSQYKTNVNVTLTVTTEITDSWTVNSPASISVSLNGTNGSKVNAVFTQTKSSNFYSATATLTPDTYTIVARVQTPAKVYLRIWSPRDTNVGEVQIGYADLADQTISIPNESDGAALRTYLFNNTFSSSTSIEIRDCTGNAIKLFDWQQTARAMSCSSRFPDRTTVSPPVAGTAVSPESWSAFVPFFCIANADPQNSICQPETVNLYTVQVSGMTKTGPYMSSKSFICDVASEQNSVNAYPDPNNNYLCGGTAVPYTRGPTCKLRDCSGAGSLYYDPLRGNTSIASYACNCLNSEGESCEQGVCPTKNQSPGTSDTLYRSLTVVVGADTASGNTASYVLENAKTAIANLAEKDNLWQYQLLIQCSTGDVYTLYIGSTFATFYDKFTAKLSFDCPSAAKGTFDMQKMFDYATAAVGRSQKGMIIFYNENPDLITVNKTLIVQSTQQYRQEIHVLSVLDPVVVQTYSFTPAMDDMIDVAFSTGGTFIVGELNGESYLPIPVALYNNILGTSVSYNFMSANYSTTDPFSFYVEDSAKAAYLVVGTHGTTIVQGTPEPNNCTGPTLYQICNLTAGSSYTIRPLGLDKPLWATVIVADGLTPMTAILKVRSSDDEQTALAVSYIDAGPTIGYQLPAGYDIVGSSDVKLRISSRTNCTYTTTSYSISDPVTPILKLIRMDIRNSTDATKPLIPKFLPIPVSSAVACQNGGTPLTDIGACVCPDGFLGADCGQIVCDDGVASAWGNACNCRDQVKGGRYCSTVKPLMSALFAEY